MILTLPTIPLLFHELLQGVPSVVGLVQRNQRVLKGLALQRPTHAHVPAERAQSHLADEVLRILLLKMGILIEDIEGVIFVEKRVSIYDINSVCVC